MRRTWQQWSVIEKGLAPGERVVTDGQLRLAPGAKVTIKTGGQGGRSMNISELFIRRPVATTLVMLGDPVLRDRRATGCSRSPTSRTSTSRRSRSRPRCPGASPETMASAVATPLERQFTTIAGLDTMNSTSILGVTQITLQFNLSRNLDAAAQDVQAAIGAASRQLPPGMPTPPTYQKVNPADQPILYIALTSPTLAALGRSTSTPRR